MRGIEIIRQIDETGRIVLPKPFREILGVNVKDNLSMSLENNAIVLRKVSNACRFCGADGVYGYKGLMICKECAEDIAAGVNKEK